MIDSEPYSSTFDAVVRYEERERATREWCRKTTRANDNPSRPTMPAPAGGYGLDCQAILGGKTGFDGNIAHRGAAALAGNTALDGNAAFGQGRSP